MNETIKFIDKLIKEYKESKDNFTRYSKTYPNDEVFSNCVKKREQQIQALEQIKTELEAWEVVKKNIGTTSDVNGYSMNIIFDFDEDYQTLKKALEVKENE